VCVNWFVEGELGAEMENAWCAFNLDLVYDAGRDEHEVHAESLESSPGVLRIPNPPIWEADNDFPISTGYSSRTTSMKDWSLQNDTAGMLKE